MQLPDNEGKPIGKKMYKLTSAYCCPSCGSETTTISNWITTDYASSIDALNLYTDTLLDNDDGGDRT